MNMLNRWADSEGKYSWPLKYGDDQSYQKAIAFLDGPGILEDWGCGGAYAKRFVKFATYRGVDGSMGAWTDAQVDLTAYRSNADYILIRHVLEHNFDWERILRNALESARKKLCLVIFTPLLPASDTERFRTIAMNANGTPDISFRLGALIDILGPSSGMGISSDTQYGTEALFYVEK